MKLHSKIALITGGASGIGAATARLFATEGASVVIADRDAARAESLADDLPNALAVATDVSDGASVQAMFDAAQQAYGRVDILVNSAAVGSGGDVTTISEADWERSLNTVLKSVFLCAKAVLPGMIERRSGAIVNISSVNGLMGLGEEPYSAAKAGVINLTQNLAMQYGTYNIRANVICPGTIRTPIWQARVERDPTVFDKLAAWYPLGRVGEAQDIANAALFLASDAASWITGAVLPVDGGLSAGNFRMGRELG